MLSVPVKLFYGWHGVGVRVEPSHTYRVTAVYDNPTGRVLHDGGMGAIGGLFVPDRDAQWPVVNPADPSYRQDLYDMLHYGEGGGMMMDHLAH